MICFRPIRELLDRDNAAVWSMLTPLRSAVNQVRRFPTLEPPSLDIPVLWYCTPHIHTEFCRHGTRYMLELSYHQVVPGAV